jgi:hypothetical protein
MNTTKTITWEDGTSVTIDTLNKPVGYTWLGDVRDKRELPVAHDWRCYWTNRNGTQDRYFSPTIKHAYQWDSGD